MPTLLARFIDALTSPRLIIGLVWSGMAALTVALVVLMRTRWGQQQPLRKCVVLSLFAHVLFAAYATTVHIVRTHPHRGNGTAIRVTEIIGTDTIDAKGVVDGLDGGQETSDWGVAADTTDLQHLVPADKAPDNGPSLADSVPPDRDPGSDLVPGALGKTQDEPAPPADVAPVAESLASQPANPPANVESPAPVDEPGAESRHSTQTVGPAAQPVPEAGDLTKLISQAVPATEPETPSSTETSGAVADNGPKPVEPIAGDEHDAMGLVAVQPRVSGTTTPLSHGSERQSAAADAGGAEHSANTNTGGSGYSAPATYRARTAPNKLRIAESYGGSAQTEAAVSAAIDWLVRHQATDGRWDASDHGAGQETRVLGRDRNGAGAQADTGLTGLALLAFLGTGQTHQAGRHAANVKRGIDYLLAVQEVDGNLAGGAELFAFMYCHGMATLALAEAYGMTGDPRLARPVQRAIAYTVAAQIPSDGGWRYKFPYPAGERGDTSHLGWQLMALKSADLSGITMSERTRQGLVRYLNSVSSGAHGGLASYRREERPTRPMTAEALVCREFLGVSPPGAADEAADYFMAELPGQGPANLYYWYYGTLAMFQLQGPRWTKWNNAVSSVLMHSQRPDQDAAGSWDPDPLWGGHGGRVFSTSLGALCLEVYYRYLPLYTVTAGREKSAK